MAFLLGVPASVGAAAGYGLAGALQQRSAHQAAPPQEGMSPGLLWELVRRPLWVLSMVATAVALGLQWLALSAAPLTLVQPLLVTGVLFGAIFSSALRHERPDRVVVGGSLLCAVGIAIFLLVARPTPGHGRMTIDEVIPLAAGLALLLVICVSAAVRWTGRVRVLALATASGVLYGVTAGLSKLAVADLQHGIVRLLTNWPVYFVVVCGVAGFLASQYAFQAGLVLSPALSVIVVLDPLVSLGIGVLWLGEAMRDGLGPILGEVLGLAVMTSGVVLLAGRAPQVAPPELSGGGSPGVNDAAPRESP